MPFSDLKKEYLKIDKFAGDKAKWKIRPREVCHCANARLLAVCRLCGTVKMTNQVVMDKIQIKRSIKKQAGCFRGKGRACGCAIGAWSVSFLIVPRPRWGRRQPSPSAIEHSKCISAQFLREHSEYHCLRRI